MRGNDGSAGSLFSYVAVERRVRADHPLRVIRGVVNATLAAMPAEFDVLYSPIGRVFPVYLCPVACRNTGGATTSP
jgi:hypothetical protein